MQSLVSPIVKLPGNFPLPAPGVWVVLSTQTFSPPIPILRLPEEFCFLPKMSSLELTPPPPPPPYC